MKLPSYSIANGLYCESLVEKLICGGVTLGILYFNLPSSFYELFSEIIAGIVYAIAEAYFFITLLAPFKPGVARAREHTHRPDFRLYVPDYSFEISTFLSVAISSPIDEEIISRGILQPLIKVILTSNKNFSIIISSIIFALQHDSEHTIRLAPLICGLLCSYLYENYGLFASIAAHITNNTIIVIYQDILPNIVRKVEQIRAVQVRYKTLDISNIEPTDIKNYTCSLMLEKHCLETENEYLKMIVQTEKKSEDCCQTLKSDDFLIDNPDLLRQHNQQLLNLNQKLRDDSLRKLSQTNVYKFIYGFFYCDTPKIDNAQIMDVISKNTLGS